MSDEPDKSDNSRKSPFWRQFLPEVDEAVIREIGGNSYAPVTPTNVDDQGVVHVWIPPALKDPKTLRISKWLPHFADRHNYKRDFDPAWHARSDEPKPTLTFWLKPGSLDPQGSREGDDARLNYFATQLGIRHDIPDLQAMLCVPPTTYTEHFLRETDGAVILSCHPRHAHRLARVKETLDTARTEAEKLAREERLKPRPGDRFLQHAISWEERFGAERETTRQRLTQSLRDIMGNHHPLLLPTPIQVSGDDGVMTLHLDRSANSLLAGGGQADDFYIQCPPAAIRKECQNTEGLALFMTPDFYDPQEVQSRKPPRGESQEAYEQSIVHESVTPQLQALSEAISRQCGNIPIQPAFCTLDPRDFKNSPYIAPTMIVLMTTPEHQQTLMTRGRSELIKQMRAAERDAMDKKYGGRHDRRGPDGPSAGR